jgi:hypothetical protein
MVYREEFFKEKKENKKDFEKFEQFLKSGRVKSFIDEWMERGKGKGIKKAGIITLLLYLWLLDEDESSVLKKAGEVLGKLLGAPKFFASFLNLKPKPEEIEA